MKLWWPPVLLLNSGCSSCASKHKSHVFCFPPFSAVFMAILWYRSVDPDMCPMSSWSKKFLAGPVSVPTKPPPCTFQATMMTGKGIIHKTKQSILCVNLSLTQFREGVKKKTVFVGLSPTSVTPPLGTSRSRTQNATVLVTISVLSFYKPNYQRHP